MTQAASPVGDVCRLNVIGPDSRVELAVPVHVPLADLLPTLVVHLDQRLATSGLEHSGWVLQRLGETPLEEDLGTAALGLYDGDTVYLRARDDQLPPIDFDDLVDGVATGIAERKNRWNPEHSRRLLRAIAGLAVLLGLPLVASLDTGRQAALAGAAVAVALLASSVATSRAFGQRQAAALLAPLGVGYAVLAGALLPLLGHAPSVHRVASAPSVLAGCIGLALASVIAAVGTGHRIASYASAATVGVLGAAAGLLSAEAHIDAAGVAALLIPVVLILGYFTPSLAAMSAGLSVPTLPSSPVEFQQDLDPEPGAALIRRAAQADGLVTALYTGLAGLLSVAAVLVGRTHAATAIALTLAVAVLLLLHSRELTGLLQRVAMLVPALCALSVLVLGGVLRHGAGAHAIAAGVLVALALATLAVSSRLARHKLMPHWGMAGDITHWLAAAAIIPLALQVAGMYGRISGLW